MLLDLFRLDGCRVLQACELVARRDELLMLRKSLVILTDLLS